ncbi:MAG: exonuclease SbcCD subunit D [bacterium]|nr:exonuclease SbcCD subunit D [bacterium]
MKTSIKILHTADLHLGTTAHDSRRGGESVRLSEFLVALDWMADLAVEEGVDLVVIAGDVYDNHRPEANIQNAFAARVRRLIDNGIPLVIVTGNHDTAGGRGGAGFLDIYGDLPLDGVTLISRPELVKVETKSGPLQILGIPWIVKGLFLDAGESSRDAEEKLENQLGEYIDDKVIPELESDVPSIIVAHLHIEEGLMSSETRVAFGQDPMMPASGLARPPFDYVALGHLHRHQPVSKSPPAVYSGSLSRRDFGDEGVPKGVVLVEITEEATKWRFVEGPARNFLTAKVTVEKAEELGDSLLRVIEEARFTEAVVRVRVSCPPDAVADLRKLDMRSYFPNSYKLETEFDVVEPVAVRRGISEELGLEEALNEYMGLYPPPVVVEPEHVVEAARELAEDIREEAGDAPD